MQAGTTTSSRKLGLCPSQRVRIDFFHTFGCVGLACWTRPTVDLGGTNSESEIPFLSKCRTHGPEFKDPIEVFRMLKVAMEAIIGHMTPSEIAKDFPVRPIPVRQWQKQLLDGTSDRLTCGIMVQS